ncbi:MAG: hypothetical protein QME45_00655 [Clostridiales bacterium]|nr:hypothetical protein [Clostridiales bacterium]HBM80262.1 hypothetical protein [Clostridiaceae bacterium]
MLTGYNPYMSYYPCSYCPYNTQAQAELPAESDNIEASDNTEDDEAMFRQPPFGPGPFYGPYFGPRPPYFGPRPPFFGPRPFFPPGPVPFPVGRPFFGLPFLTGLALGGLLF